MTYIFVDTNIFLHFRFFVEIPWGKLFSKEYQVVLAPVVLDEIDKHQRNNNPKIATRAKKVLLRIEQLVANPVEFPIQYITKRPHLKTFQKFQLDRQEQDDCILAAIIEFRVRHPNDEIIFVSNDTGPRFRASSLGIKSSQLPDELQNPIEDSEEIKRIKTLTQENNKLKNALPKLSLTFEDDSLVYKHKLGSEVQSEHEFVASHYEVMSKEFSFLTYEDPEVKRREQQAKFDPNASLSEQIRHMGFNDILGFDSLTEKQVDDYNKHLVVFQRNYRSHLKDTYLFDKITALTLPIKIKMHNKGNAPASDIDIWLHFPDGFTVINEYEFPLKPKESAPPFKPKHRLDFGTLNHIYTPNLHNLSQSVSLPTMNVSRPEIRKTNSYEVDIKHISLKHFQHTSLDTLLVIYPSFSDVISFTIDYKIIANNVPEPVTGSLSVIAS